MHPHELKTLISKISDDVASTGFHQTDKRLGRKTISVIGRIVTIDDGNILRYLKSTKPLGKFKDDWDRIKPWFDCVAAVSQIDPDSRRLLMLNHRPNVKEIEQCFTQMQLCKDDEDYTLVVNQRSGDVAKMKDDLVFFGSIVHRFEVKLKIKIRKIVVTYNHLHFQI